MAPDRWIVSGTNDNKIRISKEPDDLSLMQVIFGVVIFTILCFIPPIVEGLGKQYYLETCWVIGTYDGFAFGRFYLKREHTFSYTFLKKILFYTAIIFAFAAIYGSLSQVFEDQEFYIDDESYSLKWIPLWYLILRFTIGKSIFKRFLSDWEFGQRFYRKEFNKNLVEERRIKNLKLKEEWKIKNLKLKEERRIKNLKLKEKRRFELANDNEIFCLCIYQITIYFRSIEGVEKDLTAKLFEDKIGKKIEYIEKVETKLDDIDISSQKFWKLLDKNIKLNRKYNINKKSYIELLKFSKDCIKKNISNYSINHQDKLKSYNWREVERRMVEMIEKLEVNSKSFFDKDVFNLKLVLSRLPSFNFLNFKKFLKKFHN